jgi:hypothetical protein
VGSQKAGRLVPEIGEASAMSRACSLCRHSKVEQINAELARGLSNRDAARYFKVTKSAAHRHREHILGVLAKATEAKEVAGADRLLAEVEALRVRSMELLARAESAKDFRAAAALMREARSCLELLGRLAGELREAPTVSLVISSEWTATRDAVLVALQPYPEAALAVAAALRRRNALGSPDGAQRALGAVTDEVVENAGSES